MDQIEIILKSPTDRVAPFPVLCHKSWQVKDLKLCIESIYPCKPKVESQKLIYCGKLLSDEEILRNIFEKDLNAVVHFICQPSITIKEDVKENAASNNGAGEDLLKEYQNYLNQFYSSMDSYQQFMNLNSTFMQSYTTLSEQSKIKIENTIETGVPREEVVQPNVVNEVPAEENRQDNERRIEPARANGPQNVMAAAFGGMMGDGGEDDNDGEMEPRDVLHYFYMFVRFGLLVLICYYYSSVSSVVTTLMLFFLFFGVNLFRRNNRVNQQIEIVMPENVPVPTDTVPSIADESTGNQGDGVTNRAPPPAAPLPGMADRLRLLANTSFQFVLTFFVTLFPDPVAHIELRQ